MARVVVVGAGVMGLAAAYQALFKGWQVDVLEASPEPGEAVEAPLQARLSAERAWLHYGNLDGIFCALAVAACILLAHPVANMPFLDDFSYTKTALDFARTGHFLYNGWAVEILGWLVPWGALFIKVFGFSFTVVRFSMLPIAMATVYLFHQVLLRFGINRGNAVLGTLTLALSPLFLPLAASFMTDVPGLFVIVLCIYMCQRAVAARTDRAALLWLCSAAILNVAGGTVRQIAWLGALIMVPSTAWLLRERRGMKAAGVLLFFASLLGVLACLHWFNRQPYSVPEHIFAGPLHPRMLAHLAAQYLKTFLCILLLVFPVSVAWLTTLPRTVRSIRVRLFAVLCLLLVPILLLQAKGHLQGWLLPWLTPIILEQRGELPEMSLLSRVIVWAWIGISLLVVTPGIVLAGQAFQWMRKRRERNAQESPTNTAARWILGPFSASYMLLLAPRGTYAIIQDRYVLGLLPAAIVLLLVVYQEKISKKAPALGFLVLACMAVYSVAGVYDFYAESRAIVTANARLQQAGIQPNAIQAGFGRLGWALDGWKQIASGGYINDSRIQVPRRAYHPFDHKTWMLHECEYWFTQATPDVLPEYMIASDPLPCAKPTDFPPVRYTTWLPPFHRRLYIEQPIDASAP